MSEYIVDGAVPNHTVRVEDEREVYWHMTHLPVREEIVRCRDCEHARIVRPLDWKTGKPSTVVEEWYCQWHSNAEGASDIEPDGFCAWGERRDA